MKKRLFAVVMLLVFVVSLTSCSTSGTYVNTQKSNSYIRVSGGSNEDKGSGYARNMYCKSENEWITGDFWYDSGTVTVRQMGRKGKLNTAGFSVNKSKKQISYSGYTYKKQ